MITLPNNAAPDTSPNASIAPARLPAACRAALSSVLVALDRSQRCRAEQLLERYRHLLANPDTLKRDSAQRGPSFLD